MPEEAMAGGPSPRAQGGAVGRGGALCGGPLRGSGCASIVVRVIEPEALVAEVKSQLRGALERYLQGWSSPAEKRGTPRPEARLGGGAAKKGLRGEMRYRRGLQYAAIGIWRGSAWTSSGPRI